MRPKTMNLSNMKKSIYATLVMVVTLAVLLVSASYAWLIIARAPEITGIDTTVGANGSLEIALLNGGTYLEPGSIRTRVGASDAVAVPAVANISWGNVVDLGDKAYGLKEVSMRPSRLNVSLGGDVQSNMLMYPTYNADGRSENFSADTVSATYQETAFKFQEVQGYGVRAIGTTENLSAQQRSLVEARAAVKVYTSEIRSNVQTMWKHYGPGVLEIYYKHYSDDPTCSDRELAAIRGLAVETQKALELVEMCYRYALVGYYASSTLDEAEFLQKKYETLYPTPDAGITTQIKDENGNPLYYRPDDLTDDLETVQEVIELCDQLSGGTYEAQQLRSIMDFLWNDGYVFLGDVSLNRNVPKLTDDNILTLGWNGPVESFGEYLGYYNTFFTFRGKSVEVRAHHGNEGGYLTYMSVALDNVQPATGAIPDSKLLDTYGFVVDLGFRSNAVQSDLLLQTEGALRVEDGSSTSYQQLQGQGSYMRFASEQLDAERMVLLMDAVRIGFVDRSGSLVAVAKLNTSNYMETEEGTLAPIYLYGYQVLPDGSLLMAERQREDNTIVNLPQGQPVVLSAIVWLDGDHVDNRLASISGQSVTGTMNLQFASSANLIASGDQIIGEE